MPKLKLTDGKHYCYLESQNVLLVGNKQKGGFRVLKSHLPWGIDFLDNPKDPEVLYDYLNAEEKEYKNNKFYFQTKYYTTDNGNLYHLSASDVFPSRRLAQVFTLENQFPKFVNKNEWDLVVDKILSRKQRPQSMELDFMKVYKSLVRSNAFSLKEFDPQGLQRGG